MGELKPCPFCGSIPKMIGHRPYGPRGVKFYLVECDNRDCLVNPATWEVFDEATAIEVWNRRDNA